MGAKIHLFEIFHYIRLGTKKAQKNQPLWAESGDSASSAKIGLTVLYSGIILASLT